MRQIGQRAAVQISQGVTQRIDADRKDRPACCGEDSFQIRPPRRSSRTARANPTLSTGTITVICAAGSAAGSGSMNGNGRGGPTADAQPTLRINTSTAPPASPAYSGP